MSVGELMDLVKKIEKDNALLKADRIADREVIRQQGELIRQQGEDRIADREVMRQQEKRIEGQTKKIESQGKKIKTLQTEMEFVAQALDILLPREAVILAAQILLIKLGRQPQIKYPVRYCQQAYQSMKEDGSNFGAPFVAMLSGEFGGESFPKLCAEMDIILTARNDCAHTSPVAEVLRQSKKMVSYMNHYKEKLNSRDLLVLRILEKAENILHKYGCCDPPPKNQA